MGSITTFAIVVAGLFLALLLGLNLFVRLRARALRGKPLPELPGGMGAAIAKARNGLVYFFSPACGACRRLTPQLAALAKKNKNVFLVDVTENFEIARALRIMATPSTVEVSEGRVIDIHVGLLPPQVLERFGSY